MSDMLYLGWFLLLICQNAAFTWVSRARNGGSLWYHATASVFSNGIWLLSQVFLFNFLLDAINSGDVMQILPIFLVYVAGTVIGSVFAHHVLMNYLEKGMRRVGSYKS